MFGPREKCDWCEMPGSVTDEKLKKGKCLRVCPLCIKKFERKSDIIDEIQDVFYNHKEIV